ncbi:M16 family metallopeptidase [Kangiella sp. M94]
MTLNFIKYKITLLLLSLIFLVACQTLQPVEDPYRLPLSPAVTTGELDNGLKYYIHPNRKPTDKAYITLLLNVGSLQEEDHERGAAHFVEHMAFNGSTHFNKNELITALEQLGMQFGSDINAFTNFDNTRYHLEIPTDNPDNWSTITLILDDWMTGIKFDAEDVEKERKVILSEKRARKGLGERLSEVLNPISFSGARHAERMPIGTDETLKSMTAEDLKAFYLKWYQPQNMALIITGDVEPENTIKLFNNTIGQIQSSNDIKPKEYLIPGKTEPVFEVVKDPEILTKSIHIRYQTHSVTLDNFNALRYRLLNQIVVSLFSSRMYELVDSAEKPFEGADLGYSQLGNDKLLFNFSVTPKDGEYEQGYTRLFEEIKRVEQHGFLPSELERYRKEVLNSSLLSIEDLDSIHSRSLTDRYLSHFLYGEHYFSPIQRHVLLESILPTISAAEVSQHFNQLLSSKLHSVVAYAPESELPPTEWKQDIVTLISKPMSLSPYQESNLEAPLLSELPQKGKIIDQTAIEAVEANKYQLSNGATVIIRPSNLTNTEVLLFAYAPGGYSLASAEQQRSAMESAKLVASSGIGDYSRTDLGKKLHDKTVQLNLNIGRYYSQLSSSSAPKDLELMFQLIHLYFTQPKIDPIIAENYKNSIIQYQRNRLNDPEQRYADELHLLLTNNHPKAQPWSVEEAEKIDHAAALKFYEDRFSKANNFTFIIVGNIQPKEIEPMIEQYIASLPATEKKETWLDEKIRTVQRDVEFSRDTALDEKTKVQLQFHKPIYNYVSETRFRLGLYQELLQQELQATLREELGEVYSIGVSANVERYPTEWFNLLIGFNSEPGREDLLIDTIQDIIDTTLSKPLAQDKLDNIKQQRRVSFTEGQQSNHFWLSQITLYERENIDYSYFTNYMDRLDAVTIDQIQETAKMLLEDSYLVTSIMRPKDDADMATESQDKEEQAVTD